ncbi:MAG TPA: response regulator [Candidatus Acidoferrum sp.]|nr:response regulator [Candidatus Acidoferrum sp.]
MTDEQIAAEGKTPTVYFIDDSATMREVIKIALRKENIHVITCPDAASAIAQFSETAPDAVITDVIMPDRDGYEVCEFVKRQEQFAKTPVILMSGIVNREVAERAMAVKADELIRKPFQPQELIARVKKLLNPQSPAVIRADDDDVAPVGTETANPLRGLFAVSHTPSPSATARLHRPETPVPAPVASRTQAAPLRARTASPQAPASSNELQKLRNEIWRLELLVKKLQAELEAQRQYCTALESHLSTLQETE